MANEIEDLRLSKVDAVLQEFEELGELVLTSSNQRGISKRILNSLGVSLDQSLSENELIAVLNSINAVLNGVKVDDFDFATIIGVSKDELTEIFETLKKLK